MTKRYKYFENHTVRTGLIDTRPSDKLGIVITIPALREKNLLETLKSLALCTSPMCNVEVLVLINHPENADNDTRTVNQDAFITVSSWAEDYHGPLCFIILQEVLAQKHAGVGLARKILMDEAARRLTLSNGNLEIIVGLDADCTVSENYLVEIEHFFLQNESVAAAAIHFEHRWEGLSSHHRKAIMEYELHLRYYIEVQKYIGFPFAIQTVGSAMAVRCEDYILQRGMNKRKAGEDFYFLQKFIELGRCGEITKATVYPSGRTSDRVPFGTGKAVQAGLESEAELLTYHIQSFLDLQIFFELIPVFFQKTLEEIEKSDLTQLPDSVQLFLTKIEFLSRLNEIRGNVSDLKTFEKRFFRYFNAFMLMKYVHFVRDHYYPNQLVSKMAAQLCKLLGTEVKGGAEELLEFFRIKAS